MWTSASSSPARPSAREIASFMNETCRRTAWPSEAADCSAARSGSARRTATSVMAEDISFSSCARHASIARNQNSAMGRKMVAATMIIIGLASASRKLLRAIRAPAWPRRAGRRREPAAGPAAASMNGRLDGFCCRAKIRPPIEGASSLAAMRARGGAAGRRLAARRLDPLPSSGLAASVPARRRQAGCSGRPCGALLAVACGLCLAAGGRANGCCRSGGFLASPGRGTVLNFGRALAGFGSCPSAPIGRAGRRRCPWPCGGPSGLDEIGSAASSGARRGRLRGARNRVALRVAVVSHSPSNFGAAKARTPAPTHSAFARSGTGGRPRKLVISQPEKR